MAKDWKKLVGEMADHQKVCMISSIDEDGFPNTKAMLAPRHRDGISVFYFTTNTSSIRVQQYRKNPKACIYFYDALAFCGVMLKGCMQVLEDSASKNMIWEEGDTIYYAKGVTDPDYCVLKFIAQTGRYYSTFCSEQFDV